MPINYEIDNVDIGIMNALLKDANTPYTEIAEKLFISPGTVHVRMKKLERYGIVKSAANTAQYQKIGIRCNCIYRSLFKSLRSIRCSIEGD